MRVRIKYGVIAFALITLGCKKPYEPPVIKNPASYLVVEGTINAAPDSTTFKLSRTVELSGKTTSNPVNGAAVTIESSGNDIFALTQATPGVYKIYGLHLSSSLQYRLRIKTATDEYLSDFVPVLNSPPIDSISYVISADGITLNANTHDSANAVRYFRWEYNETWIFHANYQSYYYSNGDTVLARNYQSQQIYSCWGSDTSNNIVLGSSAKLSNSVIVGSPVTFVSATSEKLENEYSIFVKQYALTSDAYTFWTNLKKNTEQLGSIFDAQPSQINGNIHCVNNPAQPVIGYISAGATSAARIFIHNQQLPAWLPTPVYPDCMLFYFLYNAVPPGSTGPGENQVNEYINYNKGAVDPYIPVAPITNRITGAVLGYSASTPKCVDCTLRGTTVRPSFWQ